MRIVVLMSMVGLLAPISASAEPWPSNLPPCPTNGQPARFYPEPAVRRTLEGEVALNCTVGADGRYETCAVASESPGGVNFGQAAIAMARCATSVAGRAGDRVALPVHFRLPGTDTPTSGGGITVTAIGRWVSAPK